MNVMIQVKRSFVTIASADRFGSEYALVPQFSAAHVLEMPTRKAPRETFLAHVAGSLNVMISDLIILTM